MEVNKRIVLRYLFLIILMLSVFAGNTKAYAKHSNTGEDTQVGKASTQIEEAIAKGKELAEVTDYWYGGGHGGVTSSDYTSNPPHLDCSSFVHWMYYKGAGVDIDKGQVLATFGYASHYGKHYKKINSEADLNRGDLVQLNNNQHVEVYLGDGKYIGQNGDGGCPDLNGGVNITNGNWERSVLDGYKVDMAEVLEDKSIIGDGVKEELKNGAVAGSTGKEEDKDKNGYSYNPFSDRVARVNPLGLEGKQVEGASDTIEAFNLKSKEIFNKSMVILFYMSFLLIAYILYVTLLYLIAPSGFKFVDNHYTKLTGRELIHDRQETISILMTAILSLSIVGLVMAYRYLGIMALIYQGIDAFIKICMGLGG